MERKLKHGLKRACADGKVLNLPTAEDLVELLVADGSLPRPDVLEDSRGLTADDAAGLAQLVRTWVAAGQTGCYYANRLARPAADGDDGWAAQVVTERLDDADLHVVVDAAMRQIGEAGIMMLVFPYVRDEEALTDLIRQLVGLPDWWWEDRSPPESRVVKVGLRWLLPDQGHVSWVLGFAPMPWVPFTRRAPATALVMRVRPETHTVPEEEPEDGLRGVHLAHLDHGMGPRGERGGPVWTATEERKRTLLWDDLSDDGKLLATRLRSDGDDDEVGRQVMGAAWNVLAPHAKARVTYPLQRALVETLPPPGRGA